MPEEVFIRIEKDQTGEAVSVRLVVLGEFNFEPSVTRFPFPIRDSVTDNSFINLRVFDTAACADEYNVPVPASSEKCSGYTVITIKDAAVITMLRRYRLIHVDLPEAENAFPDAEQYQHDLNDNPPSGVNKGRFKILKLDHGKGGTSGSMDP